MKKSYIIIVLTGLMISFLTSCSSLTESTKDIKYMSIKFKPLTRKDFTLVGNLDCSTTISGTKKGTKKVLDPQFSSNYKQGRITKSETSEILYFAPGVGESMSGSSLYENDIFNNIYTPSVGGGRKLSFMDRLRAKYQAAASVMGDPGMDFAYYAMVEKYPNIDYFINVRFDRKITTTGKKYTEVITVKADGVILRID